MSKILGEKEKTEPESQFCLLLSISSSDLLFPQLSSYKIEVMVTPTHRVVLSNTLNTLITAQYTIDTQ